MTQRNPYAPSSASLEADRVARPDSNAIWRDGNVVVLVPDTQMPDRCVKCNEPAVQPTKDRRVYWHHWSIYVLFLINLVLYLIVALIVRKKAFVAPGLCAKHRTRRRVGLAIGWTCVVASFVLFAVGLRSEPAAAMLGLPLLLVGALVAIGFNRIVYAKRIDASYVRLKGCKRPFLDSLEVFPS